MLTNGAKGIIIAENVYYPLASLEARSIYLLQRSIVFSYEDLWQLYKPIQWCCTALGCDKVPHAVHEHRPLFIPFYHLVAATMERIENTPVYCSKIASKRTNNCFVFIDYD